MNKILISYFFTKLILIIQIFRKKVFILTIVNNHICLVSLIHVIMVDNNNLCLNDNLCNRNSRTNSKSLL